MHHPGSKLYQIKEDPLRGAELRQQVTQIVDANFEIIIEVKLPLIFQILVFCIV